MYQTSEHTTTMGNHSLFCVIKCNRLFHSIGETYNILCYLQFAVVVLVYHISTFRQFGQLVQINIQPKLGQRQKRDLVHCFIFCLSVLPLLHLLTEFMPFSSNVR